MALLASGIATKAGIISVRLSHSSPHNGLPPLNEIALGQAWGLSERDQNSVAAKPPRLSHAVQVTVAGGKTLGVLRYY
jgi:hypothetical protein